MSSSGGGKKTKRKWKQVDTKVILQNTVVRAQSSWADEVENELCEEAIITSKSLPTAPRAALEVVIDESKISPNGPFIAHLSNLPYEINETDISRQFGELSISKIELPKDVRQDRMRGFGYIELKDKSSLIAILREREVNIKGRPVRISLPTDDEKDRDRGGSRSGGGTLFSRRGEYDRTDGPDRASGPWRAALPVPGDDKPASGGFTRSSVKREFENRDRDGNVWSRAFNKDGEQRNRPFQRHDRDDYGGGGSGSGGYFGRRGGRPRDDFGRRENDNADRPVASSEPMVRPKLQVNPRTVKPDSAPAEPSLPSAIFGGAKPVDTTAKEREIEEKLSREAAALATLPKGSGAYLRGTSRDTSGDLRSRSSSVSSLRSIGSRRGLGSAPDISADRSEDSYSSSREKLNYRSPARTAGRPYDYNLPPQGYEDAQLPLTEPKSSMSLPTDERRTGATAAAGPYEPQFKQPLPPADRDHRKPYVSRSLELTDSRRQERPPAWGQHRRSEVFQRQEPPVNEKIEPLESSDRRQERPSAWGHRRSEVFQKQEPPVNEKMEPPEAAEVPTTSEDKKIVDKETPADATKPVTEIPDQEVKPLLKVPQEVSPPEESKSPKSTDRYSVRFTPPPPPQQNVWQLRAAQNAAAAAASSKKAEEKSGPDDKELSSAQDMQTVITDTTDKTEDACEAVIGLRDEPEAIQEKKQELSEENASARDSFQGGRYRGYRQRDSDREYQSSYYNRNADRNFRAGRGDNKFRQNRGDFRDRQGDRYRGGRTENGEGNEDNRKYGNRESHRSRYDSGSQNEVAAYGRSDRSYQNRNNERPYQNDRQGGDRYQSDRQGDRYQNDRQGDRYQSDRQGDRYQNDRQGDRYGKNEDRFTRNENRFDDRQRSYGRGGYRGRGFGSRQYLNQGRRSRDEQEPVDIKNRNEAEVDTQSNTKDDGMNVFENQVEENNEKRDNFDKTEAEEKTESAETSKHDSETEKSCKQENEEPMEVVTRKSKKKAEKKRRKNTQDAENVNPVQPDEEEFVVASGKKNKKHDERKAEAHQNEKTAGKSSGATNAPKEKEKPKKSRDSKPDNSQASKSKEEKHGPSSLSSNRFSGLSSNTRL